MLLPHNWIEVPSLLGVDYVPVFINRCTYCGILRATIGETWFFLTGEGRKWTTEYIGCKR